MSSELTPQQKQSNRWIAFGLALFAIAAFVSIIVRQWLASS